MMIEKQTTAVNRLNSFYLLISAHFKALEPLINTKNNNENKIQISHSRA